MQRSSCFQFNEFWRHAVPCQPIISARRQESRTFKDGEIESLSCRLWQPHASLKFNWNLPRCSMRKSFPLAVLHSADDRVKAYLRSTVTTVSKPTTTQNETAESFKTDEHGEKSLCDNPYSASQMTAATVSCPASSKSITAHCPAPWWSLE